MFMVRYKGMAYKVSCRINISSPAPSNTSQEQWGSLVFTQDHQQLCLEDLRPSNEGVRSLFVARKHTRTQTHTPTSTYTPEHNHRGSIFSTLSTGWNFCRINYSLGAVIMCMCAWMCMCVCVCVCVCICIHYNTL